ncbi:MAG TPA: aspartate/glutamate racemase family protein, partial [Longimicrobium sp.]|nr:aspartate/glutamate racemase family protein [Longimicrobium sp.]
GGLGFLGLLAARHPALPVVYLSDAGCAPYGKLPRRALAARLDSLLRALAAEHGVTHAVLACNAASTVLGDLAAPREGVAVAGIIAPALAELARRPSERLGVIGGRRTVRSDVYGRALRSAGHDVRQRVAQPLSAHVEAGRLETEEVRRDVAAILAPLRGVEVLVMACTHYPALAPLFAEHCPGAELYDPAAAALAEVEREWPLASPSSVAPAHRFLTTGDREAMRRAGRMAFGMELREIERFVVSPDRGGSPSNRGQSSED